MKPIALILSPWLYKKENCLIIGNGRIDNIKNRYNLGNETDIVDILDKIGLKIGAIRNKETDYEKVYTTVLKDLREGYLGKITFDKYLHNV